MPNIIKRLISLCATREVKDDSNFRTAKVIGRGSKQDTILLITPYGFDHNPPNNSLCTVWQMSAEDENKAGIATLPQQRAKNLKTGEVAVSNYLTLSSITWKENGDINIISNGDLNINVSGKVTINASGDVDIIAGGDINLGGAGGKKVAREGDTITIPSGSSAGTYPIVGGSSKVKAVD